MAFITTGGLARVALEYGCAWRGAKIKDEARAAPALENGTPRAP